MNDSLFSLLAFTAAPRLAQHQGETARAMEQLAVAMRGRLVATFTIPFVSVRLRLQLITAYLVLGEVKSARQLLREIDDILIHRPKLGTLIDQVEAIRSRTGMAS